MNQWLGPTLFRMLGIAALAVCAVVAAACTALPQRADSEFLAAAAEPPIVFSVVWSGDPAGSRSNGPVVVGWGDGLVVFAMIPDEPGKDLFIGRLTREQMRCVLDDLQSAGFFTSERMPVGPPDNAAMTISASRDGESVSRTWNEELTPSWGANAAADPAYKRFAKMWTTSRTALAFATPAAYQPLAADPVALKRYEVAGNTSWRAAR